MTAAVTGALPRRRLLAALLLVALGRVAPAAADARPEAGDQPSRPAPMPLLMLAGNYRGGIDVRDYWVSEKYDGVRAYWDGHRLRTRQGQPIHAPAWFIAGWPRVPLDGELWAGRGRFEQASGTVRRQAGDASAWHSLRFMVFDLPAHGGPFDDRLRALRGLPWPAQSPIQIVPQRRLAHARDLQRMLDEVVQHGGEGLMLHRADALRTAGRSTALLKYKSHDDAEATVIGHLPGRGKYTGQLGALLVRSVDGREFRIGSGLSDALRRQPPPIGTLISYRHRGLHASGLPRFATYLRVRSDLSPEPTE